MVCLPPLIKLIALAVSLLGGWLGYEVAKLGVGERLNRLKVYSEVRFIGSM